MRLDASAREALYAGELQYLGPTPALRGLAALAWDRVCDCFAPLDPLTAYAALGNDRFFEHFAPLRQGLPLDAEVVEAALEALASWGVTGPAWRIDRPRIRAVSSGAQDIPAAAPAYGQHRDTWYANPQSQVNHWLPLHPLLDEERIGFFPAFFHSAVENTSGGFRLSDWNARGGFQAYARPRAGEQFHPTPRSPLDWGGALRPAVPTGAAVRFSGHHLHGTVPHRSGRTRYTLELRVVHAGDHAAGRGAPNLDNASEGDASAGYLFADTAG
ncbi:MAG: hypothetical protein RL653_3360 [Pseudomonadota bacterium]